jgi:hypothetical protein
MSARTNVRGRRRDARFTLALYAVSALLVLGSLYAAFGWSDRVIEPVCSFGVPCDRMPSGGGTFLIRLFGGVLALPTAGLLYLAARGGEPVRTLRRTAQAAQE